MLNKQSNKMKIMKKISLYFMLVIALVSCQDSLDLTPTDSLSDADFWENESTIEGYVDYAYTYLSDYYSTRVDPDRPMPWGQFRGEACDEGYAHVVWGGGQTLTSGTLTSSSAAIVAGNWVTFYEAIQHINGFFDKYEAGTIDVDDEDEIEVWLGEMYFLRAYCYNQLIKVYGGVVLSDTQFTPDDEITQVRSDYDDCVDFILADIDSALVYLPDEADAGRATYGVALGLKSQVLLHAASPLHNSSGDEEKWEDAAEAAKAVIDLPQYSLYYPDEYIDVLYDFPSEGNTETMLGKYINGDETVYFISGASTLFGPPSWGGWGLCAPIQALVDDFQMDDGTDYDRDTYGDAPYENRELRFYANILYDGAEYSSTKDRLPTTDEVGTKVETGTYTYINDDGETVTRDGYDSQGGVLQQTSNYTRTGYYCHKYVKDDMTATFESDVVTQCVMMRLTEFYLNYAECLVMLGRGAEAREYILPIRQRAGLPDESLPDVLTMEEIMHERRIELAFEGQRFFDVRRWQILDQTFVDAYKCDVANDLTVEPATATYTYSKLQTRTYYEKYYYMPIPSTEINKNPLLEQNPGY
jgi:hypothetical protein